MTTIAQKILKTEEECLEYNFTARDIRRGGTLLNTQICERNLLDIKTVLDKHSILFWLMYGTLLGAVRDGAFISHDSDTDLGLFIESKNGFDIIIIELMDMGFDLIRTQDNDNLVSVMRDDEYVDFYFYYKDNLPFHQFEQISFIGEQFFVPEYPQALLQKLYSADWRIPSEFWHAAAYFGLDYSKQYWQCFYKEHNVSSISTSFAVYCQKYIQKGDMGLCIGCGNGRDEIYFSQQGINIKAFDISSLKQKDMEKYGVDFFCYDLEEGLLLFGLNLILDFVYCRFIFHVVPPVIEKHIIKESYGILKSGGLFFIETRSDKGEILPSGFPEHYRRLINIDKLRNDLIARGFLIIEETEETGLAIYGEEDPMIIRMICKKP